MEGSVRWRDGKGGSVKSVAPHKLLRRREAGAVLMLLEVLAYPMCPFSLLYSFSPSRNHNIAQIRQCLIGPLEG